MKLKIFKKYYLKNKIQNNIKNKQFTIFLQYNNISFKKNLLLKKKCKELNFKLQILKNKSNFLNNEKFNIFTIGQSCIIYPLLYNEKIITNFINLLIFLKKEDFIVLSIKYNNKIYNLNYLIKLLNYKNIANILFNIFYNLNKIKNPNKNLII